ncbi:MAG: glycosyltransferase family 4 protein [Gemmatimonadaceae bacterium]|nr:glycosyltransferase family 4 protein [Gemmatimonadaceae bacterium]
MKTILVGSLPPPLTGQTIAFQVAWEGLQDNKIPSRVINLSGGRHLTLEGGFSMQRLGHLFKPFCKATLLLFGEKTLYLSATQNWIGFLRDSVFILLAAAGRQRIVLHAHWGNFAGYYASLSPPQRFLVRWVLRRVDCILVLGESHRAMFDFDPPLAGKTKVVYNGLPYCKDETPLRPKRLPRSRPKLLFLSNLVLSKGYLQVLETLRILVHERRIDAECHFCGSFVLESGGSPYSTTEDAESDFLLRIRQADLAGNVHWHGPVDGATKLRILQQSHFFLLPTRLLEGQPISIIEALAFGLVVITTATPGIDEMVEGGRFGELVPFDQPHQFSRVIESYVMDPARFEAMSRASIDRYLTTFTREQHLKRLIPLILG